MAIEGNPDSPIPKMFALGIRNPGWVGIRNIAKARNPTNDWGPEFKPRTKNPEFTSKFGLDSFSWGEK